MKQTKVKVSIIKISKIDSKIINAVSRLLPIVSPLSDSSKIAKNLKEIIPKFSDLYLAQHNDTKDYIAMAFVLNQRGVAEKLGKIEDVAVDPEFHNSGIGTQLIEAIINDAKNNDFYFLELTSSPTRKAANHLYLKLGFSPLAVAGKTNYYRMYVNGNFH